jgi:hypothetical protein
MNSKYFLGGTPIANYDENNDGVIFDRSVDDNNNIYNYIDCFQFPDGKEIKAIKKEKSYSSSLSNEEAIPLSLDYENSKVFYPVDWWEDKGEEKEKGEEEERDEDVEENIFVKKLKNFPLLGASFSGDLSKKFFAVSIPCGDPSLCCLFRNNFMFFFFLFY